MLAALSEAFSAIARDSSVRAVVLAANGLSMSEIKSEHIDGVTRRELESEECARWPEQPVGLAHPCSGKGVFSRRCNRPYKKGGGDADAARRRRRHGRDIPAGSSRSAVPYVR